MPGTRVNESSDAAAITRPSTAMAAAASRPRPEIPSTFKPASSLAHRRVLDQELAYREVVEIALQKRADCVVRRADDRLLVHVESGVDHRRDAGELEVLRQNPVEPRTR